MPPPRSRCRPSGIGLARTIVAVMPSTGVMWLLPSRRGNAYSPDSVAAVISRCRSALLIVARRAVSTPTILNVVVSVWAGVVAPAVS